MAAINFPNPTDNNPDTGEQYANGWYNPSNGVTYVFSNNTWTAATVNNANFDDLYVNELGGDHMQGPLTIGPDADVNNATIELDGSGSAEFTGGSSGFVSELNRSGLQVQRTYGGAEVGRILVGKNNNWNYAVIPDINDTNTRSIQLNWDGSAEFAGDVQMASQNGGPLAGFRNLLINGNFIVTQRGGQSVTTNESKYCIDRWAVFSSQAGQAGSGAQSGEGIDVHSKSLGITLSGGATRGLELVQGIELETAGSMAPFKANAEYTVSFWAKTTVADFAKVSRARFSGGIDGGGGVTDVTVTEVNGHTGGGGWEKLEYRLTMPASIAAGQIALYLYLGSYNPMAGSSSVKFAGVQLEPGPVATPFEHRPIGTELALCQRYFQRATASSIVFNVASSGTNTARGTIPLATPMRTSTGTLYAADQIVFADRPGGTETACDVNAVAYCDRGARLQFSRVTSTADTYKMVFKIKNSATGDESDTISLDTEL